jgi:hypothetical protein
MVILEWKGERRGKAKKIKKKRKTNKQVKNKQTTTTKNQCQRNKLGDSVLINSKLNRH